MARKTKTRDQKPTIPTIVGAGITEQFYFTHLKSLLGYNVKIRPRYFGQEDIYQLSKKIENILKDGGTVIAVFDADVTLWSEDEKNKLLALKKKYADNKNVILSDSLPSIEYWFLLHFANIHRLFTNSNNVIKELTKYLSGYDKTNKYLSNPKWVEILCSDGNLNQAINHASITEEGQSYTNIPKAIAALSKTKINH